jgi:hypothetical protein
MKKAMTPQNRGGKKATYDNGHDPKRAAIMSKLFDDLAATMDHLACRWADECEYEDIADYQKVIETAIRKRKVKGLKITKMLKRPFGFECEIMKGKYRITRPMTNYGYSRIG